MRDSNTVPKSSVPKFVALVDSIAKKVGDLESACRLIGINSGHLFNVRHGVTNLSVAMARKILEAYKGIKA